MPCLLACLPGILEIEAVKNTVSYDVIFYVKIKLLVLAREHRLRVLFVFPGEALHRRHVVGRAAYLITLRFTRKFTMNLFGHSFSFDYVHHHHGSFHT